MSLILSPFGATMDRVTDPADPRRCQSSDRFGQCWFVSEPGATNCRKHYGTDKETSNEVRLYRLTDARMRDRLARHADHEEIKSLREEIGLTRILIEDLWNSAKSQTELLASCHTFNTLALTLERLLKTSHQMEQNLGLLLPKPTVIVLGQQIVHILVEELKGVERYEERIDRITGRMFDSIEQAVTKPEEK